MRGGRGKRKVALNVDPGIVEATPPEPRDLFGDLDLLVRPDLRHHYTTPICAQRWLDVCADPAYGHTALLDQVEGALPGLAEALRADGGGPSLTVTSLGPGDGSVDERILRGLNATFDLVAYCALDSSLELLRRSVHRIAHAEGLPDTMEINGSLGEFSSVSALPDGRPPHQTRLLVLTGFTLGNYREDELLGPICTLMNERDYLLLDARLHGLGPLPDDPTTIREPGGPFGSYDLASVRRFVFGPLEVATTATAESVTIDFDVLRSQTAVPHAVNLLIHLADLDTTVRLTGERVRRERMDLAVTTLYRLPDLVTWLEAQGLTVVWHQRADGVAFFLVKKAG